MTLRWLFDDDVCYSKLKTWCSSEWDAKLWVV